MLTILFILALICFLAASFPTLIQISYVNLVALAFATLAYLLGQGII